MEDLDLARGADVLILGAPAHLEAKYGKERHRFRGPLYAALTQIRVGVPAALLPYVVIRLEGGRWIEANDVRQLIASPVLLNGAIAASEPVAASLRITNQRRQIGRHSVTGSHA